MAGSEFNITVTHATSGKELVLAVSPDFTISSVLEVLVENLKLKDRFVLATVDNKILSGGHDRFRGRGAAQHQAVAHARPHRRLAVSKAAAVQGVFCLPESRWVQLPVNPSSCSEAGGSCCRPDKRNHDGFVKSQVGREQRQGH